MSHATCNIFSHLHQLTINNRKHFIILSFLHQCNSAEFWICRQDRKWFGKVKTRKSQRLAARPFQINTRMYVACHEIRIVMLRIVFNICAIMNKSQWIYPHWLTSVDIYFCLLIPAFLQDIVIAFNQSYLKLRNIVSPFFKEQKFFVGPAMKKISDDDQLFRFVKLDQWEQPLQVLQE